MEKRLNGKIAVITGGADGIGKATVERFAAEGATVVIWDMNGEKGEATAKANGASFMKVNTAIYAEVEKATAEVAAKYGRIDILVNNAGITRDRT